MYEDFVTKTELRENRRKKSASVEFVQLSEGQISPTLQLRLEFRYTNPNLGHAASVPSRLFSPVRRSDLSLPSRNCSNACCDRDLYSYDDSAGGSRRRRGPPVRRSLSTALKPAPASPKDGIKTPGVRIPFASLKAEAEFPMAPAWMAATDALIVPAAQAGLVKIDSRTNKAADPVTVVAKPCGGAVVGFDSLWAPDCAAGALPGWMARHGNPLRRLRAALERRSRASR